VGIPNFDKLQLLHAPSSMILGRPVANQTLEVSQEILLLRPRIIPLSPVWSLSLVRRDEQVELRLVSLFVMESIQEFLRRVLSACEFNQLRLRRCSRIGEVRVRLS